MRRLPIVIAMFAVMVAAILFAPLVGSTSISLAHAFDRSIPFDQNVDAQIFFIARLPRVLAAALVGGTLAAAGVIFQGLLRNPLATPYTPYGYWGVLQSITETSSVKWDAVMDAISLS